MSASSSLTLTARNGNTIRVGVDSDGGMEVTISGRPDTVSISLDKQSSDTLKNFIGVTNK